MLVSVLLILSYFTISLVVLASIIGLVRYRQLSPGLRWLLWLACFDLAMELLSGLTHHVLHIKNLFLLPFITVGELVLLSLAYRQALRLAPFGRALPWLLGLFSAYALLESLLQLGRVRHAVPLEIIYDLLQLGLAGLYFRKLLNELRVERLGQDPFFWVSVALAVHGLGSLLISLSSNYILTHYSVRLQQLVLWGLLNLFNMLLYAAYCLALAMRPQPAGARRA